MKNINQLIPDIYELLQRREDIDIPHTIHFGDRKEPPTLRLSKMGDICPRHLWYSIHHPELAEPYNSETLIKFSYGHTIERMAIALAKAAGHEVTGEQDELTVDGVKGHRDCVIDGYVVDVKSCSQFTFKKIQTGAIRQDDSFGYLAQLDGYMVGSDNDDLVRYKDTAFIWAIDKTLGKMCLYEHKLRRNFIIERVGDYKAIVAQATPPACQCKRVYDKKSGTFKPDAQASYSPYKRYCLG